MPALRASHNGEAEERRAKSTPLKQKKLEWATRSHQFVQISIQIVFASFRLSAGAGEDVGEALLESEEGRLQPTVADGRQCHGDGEGYGVAEEVTSEAGVLMVDGVVADHESEDVEDVKAVGDAAEVYERAQLPDSPSTVHKTHVC